MQIWDSVTGRFVDSVVVRSPLPDPLVPIVQWIFQRPGWVMVGGLVMGAHRGARRAGTALAAAPGDRHLARHPRAGSQAGHGRCGRRRAAADRRRRASRRTTTSCTTTTSAGGATSSSPAARCSSGLTPGPISWSTSWRVSTTSLSCHACHPFELKAQTKELFYWIMARPDKIPPTARCLATICEQCHVQGEAKKTWQRIASTAGHRTHLESDSLGAEGRGLPHVPRAHGAPVSAGRHDLCPEGLPPDRRSQDPAGPDGAGSPARRTPAQRGAALLQLLPPVHGRRAVRGSRLRLGAPAAGLAAVLLVPRDARSSSRRSTPPKSRTAAAAGCVTTLTPT